MPVGLWRVSVTWPESQGRSWPADHNIADNDAIRRTTMGDGRGITTGREGQRGIKFTRVDPHSFPSVWGKDWHTRYFHCYLKLGEKYASLVLNTPLGNSSLVDVIGKFTAGLGKYTKVDCMAGVHEYMWPSYTVHAYIMVIVYAFWGPYSTHTYVLHQIIKGYQTPAGVKIYIHCECECVH